MSGFIWHFQRLKQDSLNVQSDQAHSDERPLHDRNMKYLQTTFQMIENNIRRLDNDVQGEQII